MLFDTTEFHYDIPEIIQHRHSTEGRKVERLIDQQRLIQKWAANRERLRSNLTLSRHKKDQIRLFELAELVDHAFCTHPYYNLIYREVGYELGAITTWSDFRALPIVTKDDIINSFELFEAAVSLSGEQIRRSRTSGSSGRVLTIFQDYVACDRGAMIFMRHFDQLLGRIRRSDEWLYEVYLAPPRLSSLCGDFPVFSIGPECPVEDVISHQRKLQPKILSGFPSYFLRMVDSGLPLYHAGIEVICTNSESSSKEERERISNAFGCPVYDEYSSEELCLISSECTEGHRHIVDDCVHLEVVLSDESGRGISVGTNLANRVMPFIRYVQGDLIRIDETDDVCACGLTSRIIKEFHGRADQTLYNTRRCPIWPDTVMSLYDKLLIPTSAGIEEFRIHQKSDYTIELMVVPMSQNNINLAVLDEFVKALKNLTNDKSISVTHRMVTALPEMGSHKRRMIVSEVHK
ncbi:MAG: hypothetical protein OXH65_03260 [Paracoccaceae bacterium]|nr:hypothetical protein [Paracoccaceae bacterium]MDE2674108.1 hypothetical protein [Paracoccaceae bacterium]